MPELSGAKMMEVLTQELLIAFFFKQFMYYGSKALPCHFEGKGQKENSDAYGKGILAQFTAKLDDYEFFSVKAVGRTEELQWLSWFKQANTVCMNP